MLSNTLQFELVSPEKLLVSKAVVMVTVPGGEGEYGVLVGHAPMITNVQAGVIAVYDDENAAPSERIFVAGGFAEVTGSRCTVLAEEAISVSELDSVKLQAEADALATQIVSASDADRAALEAKQTVIMAKIAAAA